MSTQFAPEAMFTAGITDLVSVIPPGASLVPTSKIVASQVGKIPGRRLPNGLWAGYDWRKVTPTVDDVRNWCFASANVGVRADRWPGVDIDCTDAALSSIIRDAAIAKLGAAPCRTGRAPKRLLMYKLADGAEPFGRMRLWIEKSGEHHLVEVLAQGQQYLVYGTHPATLQPYQWDCPVDALTPNALNSITREQVSAFLDYLAELIDTLSVGTITREGDGRVTQRAESIVQHGLIAPSLDILRDAVRAIPNTNDLFPDRQSYLKVGYAIRAAAGADLDEGLSVFAEWAGRWEGNGRLKGNDPDTVLADWRRMRAPYAVGWSFLAEQARGFGFHDATLEFDTVAERPEETVESAPICSDQWLADRVVIRQRGVLRYVPQKSCWLVWSGGRWRIDAELLAEDIIKRELRVLANEAMRHGVTPQEKKDAKRNAINICSSARVPAIAALVKSDRTIAVSMEHLDHDQWVLNTPGGLLDLTTGVLTPAHPDALCTKITAVPPDFAGECLEWRRFLAEATGGDVETMRYLQRLCGYALTGSTREQQLTFVYGPGGNGKSVFLNVLSGVLGDYARVASMDTFTAAYGEKHTTDVAMLVGARVVTASETQAGKRWDEPRIKGLTGGEPVTARFMRMDNFTFLPQFKLVFVGNHQPEVRDVDLAMQRRIQMVPFTITPAKVDKELGVKLRHEWPAILAWMMEGCLEWQRDGLRPPASVRAATDEYFSTEDAFGRWVKERLVADASAQTPTQELFESWREFANENGEYVGSLKRLSSTLTSRKWPRYQDPKTRRKGFAGYRIENRQELGIVA